MTRRLEAEQVAFAYEQVPVLRGVSADVHGGELTGIVGPNGAGKSTLLRLLCGLLVPRTGQVLLDGKPLRRHRPQDRARCLAFLPQLVNPAFALTVFDVVALGRYPYVGPFGVLGPHDRDLIDRSLEHTESLHLRSRDFLTLSGGERQRVLLAGILAQEPELMLLDEPTSALDLNHQVEIFALLERLAQSGYGVAVVTHDLNLAARFCNRVLLLTACGELLAAGAPPDVLTEANLSRAYGAAIRVCGHPLTGGLLITADPAEPGVAAS